MRIGRRALSATLTLIGAAALVAAQQSAATLRFEAASVKPAPADAARRPFAGTLYQGNRFTATHASLLVLLRSAYGSQKYLVAEQFAGGPEWMDSERFDVAAVAAGSPTRDDFHSMERALLADRFKL